MTGNFIEQHRGLARLVRLAFVAGLVSGAIGVAVGIALRHLA